MSGDPGKTAPDLGAGAERDKGTPGLLGDALSPVVAPEETDEEKLTEPDSEEH
ncbi:hypothetical protein [Paenarthrobacter sp. NCHU4564]|uniref:hypothetical protein n=1 Tax=Paenarthrobacter sp. NCHU4564 TaxID=3451353 RepID=UPI003F9B449E